MPGLEEAEKWYRATVAPALEAEFPELVQRIAAGLAGRGSECFGFDDDISRDHDFRVGVSLWVSDEDEARYGFALGRLYEKLVRSSFPELKVAGSKLGPSEHGVVRISDFYRRHIGIPGVPQNWQEWLYTPEYAFAEAVNGRIFRDDMGLFSRIRNAILHDMPEDVRLKKIAARVISMAQSGQYNFTRCLKHGEPGAAYLALTEFVKSTVSLVFLLNFSFAPYYKWCFRAMKELPRFSWMKDDLEFLLTGTSGTENKSAVIEKICSAIIEELAEQGLSDRKDDYLEPHAFEIMKKIRSRELRELHVMEG
ncbi:MAG: DUF4037 domain-containing protein [Lentisphaeria bacterium]|nr:DUF4037 domain-containing protein [Lentisphaeria bacterium]